MAVVVIGVHERRLSGDGLRGQAACGVIGIGDAALRVALTDEPSQIVKRLGDRAAQRVRDDRLAVHQVILVGGGTLTGGHASVDYLIEANADRTIQAVISKSHDLALAIRDRRYIPVQVVGIAFRAEQWVGPRSAAVHIVIGVAGGVAVGIRNAERITVGVVGIRRYVALRIGKLLYAI